ncbi:hypothetical protein WDU94_013629 [Cyamophila willieti]
MYADDVKLIKLIRNTSDSDLLQEDIDSVTNWLSTIGLNFHPGKCNVMVYTSKRTPPPFPYNYQINNTSLNFVSEFKDLGVTFERNLNFDSHRQDIESKAYKRLGMVTRYSKPMKDLDVIKMLYQSLVRSILEYGTVLWLPKTICGTKSIERVQSRFVRSLFYKENGFYPLYPEYIESELLVEHLQLETLENRRQNEQLKLIQNIMNGKLNSPYLLEILEIKVPNIRLRHTRSRDARTFHTPNKKENYVYKSPIVSAMEVYNNVLIKPTIFQ